MEEEIQTGWISLHRKLLNNPIIYKPSYFQLWIILLLMASHKESKIMWNGEMIIIKEGQILTGRDQLAKKSGLPPTTIERILKFLENGHQIGQQKSSKYRVITILNWNEYQKADIKADIKRTSSGHQTDTYNNEEQCKTMNNKSITTEQSSEINKIFQVFYKINPTINFGHRGNRKAVEELLKKYNLEDLIKFSTYAVSVQGKPYAPVITTPYQLKEKLTQLKIYYERQRSGGAVVIE